MPLERREAAIERVNKIRVELCIPEKNFDGSLRSKWSDEGNCRFVVDYAERRSPL